MEGIFVLKMRYHIVLLIVFLTFSLIDAQQTDRQMFDAGLSYYKQHQYQEAQKNFFLALKNFPNSRIQTAIKLMLAKSYYKIEEYSTASLVISDFILKYQKSKYLDDIYFLNGEINFRQADFSKAVEEWLWIIYNGNDDRLKNKTKDYIFRTMVIHMSDSQISDLSRRYSDNLYNGLLEVVNAQKLILAGDRSSAERRLERFIENYPYHLYSDIAKEILRGTKGATISSNSILVLKSGEEETRNISEAIAKGLYYAAYEISQRDEQKVLKIDTLTTQRDVLSTVKETMYELRERQPLAIIGPFSDEKNTALTLLSKYEMFPYISPLSSQNGLADLSQYAFQINPDAEIKGRFLANYAVKELNFNTFAILAPADPYGVSVAKGFEETIIENEREIVEKQWYYEGTQDFSRQLKAIRNKGFFISFRDSVQSIDSTLTIEEIQEQFQRYMTEILFKNEGNREIDSTQVPSTGIDVLFIITYPEYVPYMAPQYAFQNIETTLLGNEGWNNKELLMQQRVYLDGLIYISAGYYDPESWNYKAFQSRFRQRMQETPEIYHLLGYDIGKWLMSHYKPGINRRDFRDQLLQGGLYQGILENIQFGIKPRVNSELNIIRFYRGQLLKVK
jgi:ABC-type branched-subunit amino acid transport system substrate-binding protein/outer membrane protein assembly factor BamD (BamD/ComL family)